MDQPTRISRFFQQAGPFQKERNMPEAKKEDEADRGEQYGFRPVPYQAEEDKSKKQQ